MSESPSGKDTNSGSKLVETVGKIVFACSEPIPVLWAPWHADHCCEAIEEQSTVVVLKPDSGSEVVYEASERRVLHLNPTLVDNLVGGGNGRGNRCRQRCFDDRGVEGVLGTPKRKLSFAKLSNISRGDFPNRAVPKASGSRTEDDEEGHAA
eukprot:CAMPEP_0204018164 /NCGR_PEP_ID=MMETSP0360-20130528/27908_1 /ASSEMBLY_ACC=CAM_ASM_000342 /TAXON_ID=268821 /ORGANISM="Scrippsiella Hangoei, Strain SHTV-5" /LENGTH=151 /DNA_ID=CAMNT_0050961279 /DNA_START=402 /DNA_END=853 /DNA_ORIENTATION=+